MEPGFWQFDINLSIATLSGSDEAVALLYMSQSDDSRIITTLPSPGFYAAIIEGTAARRT
jgi:hypothetical protein